MLSNSCEYGLRAVLYLASLDSDGYVSIRTISDRLDISFPFLTKIFQQLKESDLLVSQRGPNGGVAFNRPAGQISLYDVVVAIDGDDLFTECVLGLPGCGDKKPCPVHERWMDERTRLRAMFEQMSLADAAETMSTSDVRLAES